MDAYLIDAVRTPFGKHRGGLAGIRTDDLAALPIVELVKRHPGLDPARIDDVILGDTNGAGEDNRNVARMAVLLAGLPETVPGVTVNRLCGSGGEAITQAARAVRAGDADLIIAGGVESMTRAPFVIPKPDVAAAGRRCRCTRRRSAGGWSTRSSPTGGRRRSAPAPRRSPPNSASAGGEQDEWALRSHERAAAAWDKGLHDGYVLRVSTECPGTSRSARTPRSPSSPR